MQVARRLYLYVMAGIAGAVAAGGLVLLLRVLLDPLFPDPEFGGPGNVRQQLSQAIAMLAVGTPVWAIHWWLAQRGTRPGRSGAEADRGSAIRAAYFTLVLLVSLGIWFAAALTLGRWLLRGITDTSSRFDDPLATATLGGVALGIWAYHGLARRRDQAGGPVSEAAAWLPRLYLYGVAVVALFVTVESLSDVVVALLTPLDPAFNGTHETGSVLERAGQAAAWGGLWLGHWLYAGRLVLNPVRGAAEGVARTRVAAFVVVILGAAAATLGSAAETIQSAIAPLLQTSEPTAAWRPIRVVVTALGAALYAGAWAWHRRALRREPAAADPLRALHQVRLVSYGLSGIGLAIGATAAGWLIGLGLDALLGGVRTEGQFGTSAYSIGQWLSLAAVGLPAWAWSWRGVSARRRSHPDGEARSTIRRTYLFAALAIALVTALSAATLILYRLVGVVIDAALSGNVISELSTPAGALIAAAAVLAHHGLALRGDLRLAARATRASGQQAEALGPIESPTVGAESTSRALRLIGPAGADLDAALAAVRSALPDGFQVTEAET